VQDRTIAWPDAQHQAYDPSLRLDREALLPLLDDALARPGQRKLIVLHAYNAHSPYRDRYRSASAPFPTDAGDGATGAARTSVERKWDEYDNAIDETMRFLQEVVGRLRAQPGASFLVFTSDHGENMLDDARKLTDHALKLPTLWDTMVPGILWASPTWRETHRDKWLMLTRNRTAALMHMDFVPTLLGAADIRYSEPRTEPVDLTARAVPPRTRYTQVRAGETATIEMLRRQAQAR
jgi:glucan phosphoethanolaminetransferase (alkaline phosphatase superfamily)